MTSSCLGPEWVHAQVNGLDRWAAASGGAYVQTIQQCQTGPGEQPRYALFVNHQRVTMPEMEYGEGCVVPAHDVFDTLAEAQVAAGFITENLFIGDQPNGWDCPPSPPGRDDPTTEPARTLIAAALAEGYDRLMRPLQPPPAPMINPAMVERLLETLPPGEAVETAVMNCADHMRRQAHWLVTNYPELWAGAGGELDDFVGELRVAVGEITQDELLDQQIEALVDKLRDPRPLAPADHPSRVASLASDSPYQDALRAINVLGSAFVRAEAAGLDAAAHARTFARAHYGRDMAAKMIPLFDELGLPAAVVGALQAAADALAPKPPKLLTPMEGHAISQSLAAAAAASGQRGAMMSALDALMAAYAADGYTGRSPAFRAGLRVLQDAIQRQVDAGGFGKDGETIRRRAQMAVDVWCSANDFPPIEIKVGDQAPSPVPASA
jgi:hypothetical protein